MRKTTSKKAVAAGLLHLFQPGFSQNGALTALTPERALWMLAYLAVHDRWVSRDEVTRLLWPDADPESARGTLRQLLYRTKTLGWAPDLEVERTQLRWSEGSDLHLFRLAITAGRWEEALKWYQGELLSGFDAFEVEEFSAWLELERRDLNSAWRDAARKHSAMLAESGRFDEVATLLERILREDNLAEDVLADYLRAAYQSGRRDRALELYRDFAKQLQDELGLEPRPETQQLFEAIHNATGLTVLAASEPAGRTNRLPATDTRLIGRKVELEWFERTLSTPGARVLSLVGPGGMGKTRLALEVARRFAGRAVFVSLVGHNAGQSLAPAVAEALGQALSGKAEPETELLGLLEGQDLLLVLDNVEQVLEEARHLAVRLQALEGVQLLFTSRVRLGLAEEHGLEIEGLEFPRLTEVLAVPPGQGHFEGYDAVRLLLETVRRANPNALVSDTEHREAVRICQRVVGMPLALILAGSWSRLLSLAEIATELDKSLDFLEGAVHGLPKRHDGMRAVFEHSWALLSEGQRRVLRRLSVFRGGFHRDAALEVAEATNLILLELLDSSLLRRTQGEPNRFDLHELVRQYAQEKLEQDHAETAMVLARHADWFLKLSEEARLRERSGAEMVRWYARIGLEHDNLRSVLAWAEASGQVETTIRIARALMWFWSARGHTSEGRGWLSRALGQLGALTGTALHARALHALGNLAYYQGDLLPAAEAYTNGLEVARAVGATAVLPGLLNGMGIVALYRGDYPEARTHFEEYANWERQWGHRVELATALNNLAIVYQYQQEYDTALRLLEEGYALRTEVGDVYGQSISLYELGTTLLHSGKLEAAKTHFEQSLELSTSLEDRQSMAISFSGLGALAFRQADHAAAREWHHQSLKLSQVTKDQLATLDSLEGVADVLTANGQARDAVRLWAAAEHLRERNHALMPPYLKTHHETQVQKAQTMLGPTAFANTWQLGRALTLEQALKLALEALGADKTGG